MHCLHRDEGGLSSLSVCYCQSSAATRPPHVERKTNRAGLLTLFQTPVCCLAVLHKPCRLSSQILNFHSTLLVCSKITMNFNSVLISSRLVNVVDMGTVESRCERRRLTSSQCDRVMLKHPIKREERLNCKYDQTSHFKQHEFMTNVV